MGTYPCHAEPLEEAPDLVKRQEEQGERQMEYKQFRVSEFEKFWQALGHQSCSWRSGTLALG